jgi:type IV secretory pathway TraG/TraD family ATPase VirD4
VVTGAGFSTDGEGAYYTGAAISALRIYLHAAALGNKTMRDVVRWSTKPTSPEPTSLLRQAEAAGVGAKGWASALEALSHAHPEQVGSTWAKLVQALSCFADPKVLAACSPARDEVLDMKEFLSGRNTLYILGKEQKNGSVAPVVTAMLEDMFDQVRKVASRMPSSRLDPPLTVELNEAAHIAPLPNLPAYMGDSGGFSISLHVYLQSLSQARSRWGEHEAMIMWDNAAIRVIMGGAGNVEDLDDVSRLMGEVHSPSSKPTLDEGKRVLSPDEVRTLRFGTAVVVARAARPVEVELLPWWERKDGSLIAAGKAETEKRVYEYSDQQDRDDPLRRYIESQASEEPFTPVVPGPRAGAVDEAAVQLATTPPAVRPPAEPVPAATPEPAPAASPVLAPGATPFAPPAMTRPVRASARHQSMPAERPPPIVEPDEM